MKNTAADVPHGTPSFIRYMYKNHALTAQGGTAKDLPHRFSFKLGFMSRRVFSFASHKDSSKKILQNNTRLASLLSESGSEYTV